MSRLTIVVPCFNEAARLDVQGFLDYAERDPSCRFLFVNDGSKDRTLEVLDALIRLAPARFLVHDLPRNQGKAEAVRQGVLAAQGQRPEMIGYWDADLATPLELISEFRAVLDQHPQVHLVLGSRVRLLGRAIQRRPLRHFLGRFFATTASLVLGLPVYDTQCGAKLFRATPEMLELFAEPFQSRWIFDVELLARLAAARRDAGMPAENALYELPLSRWEDVAGSKLRAHHFARAVLELTSIGLRYRRRRPEPAEVQVLPIPEPVHDRSNDRKAA